MSWIATAIVGGALIGGIASNSAANKQSQSAGYATDTQKAMYDQTMGNLKPYMEAGTTSLGQLQGYMNGSGSGGPNGQPGLLHSFNSADLKSNLSPNYNFQLGQVLGAVTNANSATGGLVGGNSLKGINDYAQNYAGNAYQQAFTNYNTNQQNIYSRLGNLANLGQNSAAGAGQTGAQYSQGIAGSIMGGGNAQAAGMVGTGNAISGGANNLAGYYQLNNLLAGSGGSGGSGGTMYTDNTGWVG